MIERPLHDCMRAWVKLTVGVCARCSNNFVRYAVYETFRRCADVLTIHVLNVDEVVRRIQSVLTSNDPVARAITLRTLCAMPDLVADRLDVHHAIRDCWSSKHELEREAVLWAMDKYDLSLFHRVTLSLQSDTSLPVEYRPDPRPSPGGCLDD